MSLRHKSNGTKTYRTSRSSSPCSNETTPPCLCYCPLVSQTTTSLAFSIRPPTTNSLQSPLSHQTSLSRAHNPVERRPHTASSKSFPAPSLTCAQDPFEHPAQASSKPARYSATRFRCDLQVFELGFEICVVGDLCSSHSGPMLLAVVAVVVFE